MLSNKGDCWSITLLSNEEMACTSGKNINIFKIYGCDFPLKKLTGHQDQIWELLLHTDRQHLLSASHDGTTRMWNLQSGFCVRIFKSDPYTHPTCMIWFKENVVVTGGIGLFGNNIKFWNIYTGKCLRTLETQQAVMRRLVVDSNGVLITCGFWSDLYAWIESESK